MDSDFYRFIEYFFGRTPAGEFEDELRTIFLAATQKASAFRGLDVYREFSSEDAHIMALSLGVALELLSRYELYEKEQREQNE